MAKDEQGNELYLGPDETILVPDYTQLTISRDKIVEDLGRRLEQADRIIALGNTLKSNLYSAAKKVGVTKLEIKRAKYLSTAKDLGGSLLKEIDPLDLDKVRKN